MQNLKEQKISIDDLVILDDFKDKYPIVIDAVYANPHHKNNIFKKAIYKPNTKIIAHKDMAKITIKAAEICNKKYGWILEVKDCLRPIEAQASMLNTKIVKENPAWLEEPRLLSPPGKGGHPRAMAIDLIPITENGDTIDMGTEFDHLVKDKFNNPSARNYADFEQNIIENRVRLSDAMLRASEFFGFELLPLPQEWWDFRFMPEYSNKFMPISNRELPKELQFVI